MDQDILVKQVYFLSQGLVTVQQSAIQKGAETGASFAALASLVAEIALKLGCDPERFERLYSERHAYWLQHFLEQIEDQAPDLAAQIDQRSSEAGHAGEPYEPLFPEQS